jgi:hypothetical protein
LVINAQGHIFAGAVSGVFRSIDNGESWTSVNDGLTIPYVYSLAIDTNGYIFAATFRGGVFRSVEPVTAVRENSAKLPMLFSLLPNYPNPFNPSTTIRYVIPKADYLTLKVYDVLGKEIATLVSEKQAAGEHAIRWNPVGLPGGVYFYRLQTGEFVATKKLILLQ